LHCSNCILWAAAPIPLPQNEVLSVKYCVDLSRMCTYPVTFYVVRLVLSKYTTRQQS
jgi:hypothetical protein